MPNTAVNCDVQPPLQVAVGVIFNADQQVLVAQRAAQAHQGGLWEFPGGKLEQNETVEAALRRELYEEIGVTVLATTPLVTIRHSYPDLTVQLNVLRVAQYEGRARGMEGQAVSWVNQDALLTLAMPAANWPIITAVRLPDFYAVLDESCLAIAPATPTEVVLVAALQHLIQQNITFIQLRLKTLKLAVVEAFLKIAMPLADSAGVTLLINAAYPAAWQTGLGVHLTSADLSRLTHRPDHVPWLAASCHNLQELKQAEALGVDFAVLAPVQATLSHPNVNPLGWAKFAELVAAVNIPVFALGGMQKHMLLQAKQHGAQGIAGIRLFWD